MRLLILGVNGVAGRSIASEARRGGWEVIGTGRDGARFPAAVRDLGVRFARADRYHPAELAGVLGEGADVVVDCLCYTAEHARQLVEHQHSFGSAVVLSSKAVYVDDHRRHSNSQQPPRFGVPVQESQRVLEPDFSGLYQNPEGYGTNKVAAELTLLKSTVPVSILRASRIHGPGSSPSREWFVVKRLLDGRGRIPLAHRGRTGNHPTAAVNLARLAMTCARKPATRVVNAADPDPPTADAMVEAIAAACHKPVQTVGLRDDTPPELGWSPWATWPPFFLDTTASIQLGYEPAGGYAETVAAAVDDLLTLSPETRASIESDRYFENRFDYQIDDTALAYEDRNATN